MAAQLRARILLVESDASVGLALAEALHIHGFASDVASTVAQARAMCGLQRYDVVVCDRCIVPGDGEAGMEFVLWLGRSSPWTRSLLLTSRLRGANGSTSSGPGPDLELRRPQPLAVLADALHALTADGGAF